MAFTARAFNPATGLLDTATYVSAPADETAARQQFQTVIGQVKTMVDNLVADLEDADSGTSGAEQIGSALISGVSGTTIRAQIADLKTQIDSAVAGTVTDLSITTAKLAADAVTGAKIADDAVDSEHYAATSIDTEHLSADCVTGAKIADDTIDSEHYAAGSIDAEHLANGSVTNSKIGALAVATANIANGAVTATQLGTDCVNGTKIADDAIDSEHYVDGSIDKAHLSADCVDGTKIADDSIDSEHYVDGSIDEAHIANGAVTQTKLASSTYTTPNSLWTGTWTTGTIELDVSAYTSFLIVTASAAIPAYKFTQSGNTKIEGMNYGGYSSATSIILYAIDITVSGTTLTKNLFSDFTLGNNVHPLVTDIISSTAITAIYGIA